MRATERWGKPSINRMTKIAPRHPSQSDARSRPSASVSKTVLFSPAFLTSQTPAGPAETVIRPCSALQRQPLVSPKTKGAQTAHCLISLPPAVFNGFPWLCLDAARLPLHAAIAPELGCTADHEAVEALTPTQSPNSDHFGINLAPRQPVMPPLAIGWVWWPRPFRPCAWFLCQTLP